MGDDEFTFRLLYDKFVNPMADWMRPVKCAPNSRWKKRNKERQASRAKGRTSKISRRKNRKR